MSTIGEGRCYLSTESAVADPLPAGPAPEVAVVDTCGGGHIGDAGRGHPAVRRDAARAVVPTRTPATTATPTTADAGGHDVCGRSRPAYRGTRFARQMPQGRHRRHRGRRHESAEPHAGSKAAQVGRVVDLAPRTQSRTTMLMMTMNSELRHDAAALAVDGMVDLSAPMRIPNSPKIAPDAPTDGTSPPNTKLAVDPAAAHVR